MKEIILTNGGIALVDDQDFESLSQFNWFLNVGYACRYTSQDKRAGRKRRMILMHRQILGADKDVEIDHANMNRLDNRRCNLRVATRTQNSANRTKSKGKYTSTYKGVHYNSREDVWVSKIQFKGKAVHLGRYKSEEQAANAYNEAAVKLFGEFAALNKIPNAANRNV